MRTLILTCNTGGGHNTCAAAIAQAYHRQGLVCDTADALQFTSLRLSRFLSWGHTTMYRRIPGLFRRGYRFAEQHPSVMSDGSPLPRLLSAGSRRLYEYIRQGQYDAVLCVHVFAGVLLQQTLQDFPLTLRTGFVATDYTCSPGAAGDLDYYFIPHRSLCGEFIAGGTAPERLVISGIPIDRRFTADTQRPAAQPRHLVMICGSMGCGPMEELTAFFLRHLPQEAALTVVCGSNEKLRRRLSELVQGHENIRICGFVTDMAELLDSADLCLTKPGGLSTTETAAMGVPMVLIDAVAGCETHNMRFFLDCGGAVTADEPRALGELCLSLLDDPARRAEMTRQLRAVSKPDAAMTVCAVMTAGYQKREASHGCMGRV